MRCKDNNKYTKATESFDNILGRKKFLPHILFYIRIMIFVVASENITEQTARQKRWQKSSISIIIITGSDTLRWLISQRFSVVSSLCTSFLFFSKSMEQSNVSLPLQHQPNFHKLQA
jgi:hypothetical protein